MKISLFFQELLSVLITPFVLWYSLPNSAAPAVDFFRDFSIHVDGLGYVCSFAMFNFNRHGDARVRLFCSSVAAESRELILRAFYSQYGAPASVQDDRWKSKQGKMEKVS